MRRTVWITLVVVVALVAAGAATAIIIHDTQPLEARFEAHAIGRPQVTFCPSRAPGGVTFEADYRGTFTAAEEELVFTLRLEMRVDRDQELGAAEGTWTLVPPPDGDVVAHGELVAVFDGGELHGMLIGVIPPPEGDAPPPEGDVPPGRLLANFSASLTADGNDITGAIGDPSIAPNPGVLILPGNC
jgi:hypothetical protein